MLLVNISPGSFLWDIQIVSAQIFKDKVPSALYDVLQSMTEATLLQVDWSTGYNCRRKKWV